LSSLDYINIKCSHKILSLQKNLNST
jgi:hypothetical protein